MTNEWTKPEHAEAYLVRMKDIPHRAEGEATLLSEVPTEAKRVLDLGCGNGHLLSLVLTHCPASTGVGLDFSPTMLEEARERFSADQRVTLVEHNMDDPLPDLGSFDCIVSSFAIHHCTHQRKRMLYTEAFSLLEPGGVFCNLEHVSSPTQPIHDRFVQAMGMKPKDEDPSNKLLDVATQLAWLREIGFEDVDCHWKWRELPLGGTGADMGKVYEVIGSSLRKFIQRQQMFFVATAPVSLEGLVNLSPKGLDSLRILDERTVAYVDLVGSGIETVAHLKENGRIALMFCAFDSPPKIVRLHGRGEVIEPAHAEFESLRPLFPGYAGLRTIIRVHCIAPRADNTITRAGIRRYRFLSIFSHRINCFLSATDF